MPEAISRRRSLVFLAVLVLVAIGASWPGLTGDWVYDDIALAQNREAYDSFDDIVQVAVRDSSAYLSDNGDSAASDRTYRPTTELTIVPFQVIAPQPGLHHIVGLLLHFAAVISLYFAMKTTGPLELEMGPAFLAALFALHPVGVESWVYINGRSDLVAGCLLAGLALVLRSRSLGSPRTLVGVALLAFVGAGAKETFCIAAPMLALAQLLARWSALEERRPAFHTLGAVILGVGLEVAVRVWIVPIRSTFASGSSAFTDTSLLSVFGDALLVACDRVLFLRAEPMLGLASLTVRAPSFLEILAGACALVLVVLAVRARDFRAVTLVAGALLAIVPTVVVSRAVWLGLDRYLYMPMILVALAASPHFLALAPRLGRVRTIVWSLGGLLLVAAAVMMWVASSNYADQRTFERALLTARPDDSVGFAYVAMHELEQGRPAVSAAVLAELPNPPWPEAVLIPLIVTARGVGDFSLLDRAIRYGEATFPENALLRAHAMVHYYGMGDDSAAARLAESFVRSDLPCVEVGRQVAIWARDAPGPRRELWQSVARRMPCRSDP